MKKIFIAIMAGSLLLSCKKERLPVYQIGDLVEQNLKNMNFDPNIADPMIIDGIYYQDKDYTFYYVHDQKGRKIKNIADYQVRPYKP